MVLYFLASNLHLLMPLQTVIADSDFWNSWVWLNTHLCRDILGRRQKNEISNISSRNKVSIKLLALSVYCIYTADMRLCMWIQRSCLFVFRYCFYLTILWCFFTVTTLKNWTYPPVSWIMTRFRCCALPSDTHTTSSETWNLIYDLVACKIKSNLSSWCILHDGEC